MGGSRLISMWGVALTVGLEVTKAFLICVLLAIYMENYRNIKSKFTLGLLMFAAILLAETIMAIGIYSVTSLCRAIEISEVARPVLSLIEVIGIAILVWITRK
ncbi:hypothetical protein DRO64_05580 [Candidatus Bathyarchaeota archaeon]|nr:MAG: hypothetical protein DRO64_05580 [Candidatus Bathyarchaeota archaeon]